MSTGSTSAGARKQFLGLVSEASLSVSAKMKFVSVKERKVGHLKCFKLFPFREILLPGYVMIWIQPSSSLD